MQWFIKNYASFLCPAVEHHRRDTLEKCAFIVYTMHFQILIICLNYSAHAWIYNTLKRWPVNLFLNVLCCNTEKFVQFIFNLKEAEVMWALVQAVNRPTDTPSIVPSSLSLISISHQRCSSHPLIRKAKQEKYKSINYLYYTREKHP